MLHIVVLLGILSVTSLASDPPGTWDPDKFLEEAGQIYTSLFHKYNHRVRPPDPEIVEVEVQATLVHLRNLNVIKQEMETIFDWKIVWYDKRLSWYPFNVHEITVNISAVWAPDIIYTNAAMPPRTLFNPKVRISDDGQITWFKREVAITLCPTDPYGQLQQCNVSLSFLTADDTKMFTNTTTFTLGDDFSNHEWTIERVELDASNTSLDFALALRKKSEEQMSEHQVTGPNTYNCSTMAFYQDEANGSDARVPSQRSLSIVLALFCVELLQERLVARFIR